MLLASINMSKIIKKDEVQKMGGTAAKASTPDIMPAEGGGILNKKVLEAKDKAQLVLDDASQEAEHIKEDARRIYEQVNVEMEKAKKDGFKKGHDEAMSSVTEQTVHLSNLREKFYENAEPEILKLVMIIAEKVIGKMVREYDSAIKSIVRQAVDSSLGERITVHLNPEDHKIITSSDFEFKDIFDRSKRIAFREDETINKGGCVVETEVGTIDARLETQLKAIKKALEL
ncbi:MAG: hypothetical protein COV46_03945 [Deltaproteobacteria bacterium CG11_big_fil_rev_8_21_14_0_20_49_13]|nr:MAG: hypothetical protein COV46_03945 [Deltaproteobacteria bacterium CG11_big_fil_rev_8_21_14_0_20_49_13]